MIINNTLTLCNFANLICAEINSGLVSGSFDTELGRILVEVTRTIDPVATIRTYRWGNEPSTDVTNRYRHDNTIDWYIEVHRIKDRDLMQLQIAVVLSMICQMQINGNKEMGSTYSDNSLTLALAVEFLNAHYDTRRFEEPIIKRVKRSMGIALTQSQKARADSIASTTVHRYFIEANAARNNLLEYSHGEYDFNPFGVNQFWEMVQIYLCKERRGAITPEMVKEYNTRVSAKVLSHNGYIKGLDNFAKNYKEEKAKEKSREKEAETKGEHKHSKKHDKDVKADAAPVPMLRDKQDKQDKEDDDQYM
jgi:hypothetical protein